MPGFFVLAILLAFPVLEIYTLVQVGHLIGWWLAVWLIVAAILGGRLVREGQMSFVFRLFESLQRGQALPTALFGSGRTMLAGWLLIFPGVISDVLALILLLLPNTPPRPPASPPEDGVIEGEFRRED
ncbi:MAG: FxsA family protein [Sulfuricellaceae bacterium]|nr:FxsA family protein [Sulfuricellaceae bacterium]